MEVEHFLPKKSHADKVVEWDNLLPASKFCNGKKNDRTQPIVHPVRDVVKDHLYMIDSMIYGKTSEGKNSVIILGLNDEDHLLKPRMAIRLTIQNELYKQYQTAKNFDGNPNETTALEISQSLENLIKQGTRKEAYSATVATAILNDPHYLEIKAIFRKHNLWTADFETIETELTYCALDTKP